MKRVIFILLFCLFFANSCILRRALSPVISGDITKEKTFVAQRVVSGSLSENESIKTYLVRETSVLAIYVEEGYTVNEFALGKVLQDFETYYPSLVKIYGEHGDIDNNSKILLVLMKINTSSSSEANTSILGYFMPSDLIYNQANNGEILYMDVNRLNSDPDKMAGTILHELQHLINYHNTLGNIDVWLNEALSESTSILYNDVTAERRIEEFNAKTLGYYCFYTWTLPSDWALGNNTSTIFANYPSASVFMHWLYLKANKNSDIFKNIASIRYGDSYQRVLQAAIKYGIATSWDDLLLNWISDVSSGVVKFNGKTARIMDYQESTGASAVKLYPGALISIKKTDFTPADGNIIKRKISANAGGKAIESLALLNKDTTVSDTPSGIQVALPTLRARTGLYNIFNNDSSPNYIDIILDEKGNIRTH